MSEETVYHDVVKKAVTEDDSDPEVILNIKN